MQEFSSKLHMFVLKHEDGTPAVIGNDRKGFVCHSCKYNKHSCSHILCLLNVIKTNETELPDFIFEMVAANEEVSASNVKNFVLHTASTTRVSWETTSSQRRIYSLSRYNVANALHDGSSLLVPADRPCGLCGGSMDIMNRTHSGNRMLLLRVDVIPVTVLCRECADCGHVRIYCGSDDGILNMKTFLVGHDVLRDYLYSFLTGNSCSLVGYHEKWKMNMLAAGIQLEPFINYQQWRFSWYSFLNLLDIDYEMGFKCNVCGRYPSVSSCNATSLGFKRYSLVKPVLFQMSVQEMHSLGDEYLY